MLRAAKAAPRLVPLLAIMVSGCGFETARGADGAPDAFYESEVLEIIVPFGPGGGTDVWTRMMVPHLQKRLGGGVVQVLNVPGASSLAGANEFAVRRRHDGYTALATTASTYLAALLGEPVVRYDFKEFAAIIGSPLGGVVYVAPELGVQTARELADVTEQLTYGGISAVGLDLVPLLAFEVLGLDVELILGYADRAATRLAFQRRELTIDFQTIPAYMANVSPLVEEGTATPMFSFGVTDGNGQVVRDPAMPHLPTVRDVYIEIFGHEPEGVEWDAYKAVLAVSVSAGKALWLHHDAPAAAVSALREAAADVATDPLFLEAARAEVGDYPFYVGEDLTRATAAAEAVSPESVRWLQDLLRRKFGVDRLQGSR